MVPVLVATCTTNIVLAPLALMPGMGGFLFRPLALAVTFAMVSSFLLSRTFVPMMCAKFLPDEHREPCDRRGRHGHDGHGTTPTGFFGRIHHRIERVPRRGQPLATPPAGTGAAPSLQGARLRRRADLARGRCLSFRIGREFFPQVDAGQITMYLRCPSNLRLDASEKRVDRGGRLHPPATSRQGRAGDDRHRNGRRSRLVGGLHATTRASRTPSSASSSPKSASSSPGICHQAAPCLRRRSRLRRPARQLQHRRHGLHRPEQRRRLADRHPDRGRQARGSGLRLAQRSAQPGARHRRASPTPACCSASTLRT